MRTRLVAIALVACALGVLAADTVLPERAGSARAAGSGFLLQQVSSDPYTDFVTQHETEVEPDTFAFGSTIVSAFQVGRNAGGGASNIGWATSVDGGETWTSGLLPSLTTSSSPPGPYPLASDPSVAYDAVHGYWLISALAISQAPAGWLNTGITVSRSTNGIDWGPPFVVVPLATGLAHDKEWIVCDNGASSPYEGRCYVSWTYVGGDYRIVTSASTNGGLSWGTPVASVDNATGLGTQPVVQPDGTLIVVFCCMGAIRSTDGGASFSPMVSIAGLQSHATPALRLFPLPSVEVDAGGTLYAAWPDCRFRTGCSANDIVISTSPDGLSWSAVTRIPIDGVTSAVDHFLPGLGVDPSTAGASAKLALIYYYYNDAACTVLTCELNVGFVSSEDGASSWSVPRPLNGTSMSVSWLADTISGRMVGDYMSTSFVAGNAVTVFPIATQPDPSFHEAMYAATVDLSVEPKPVADTDGDGCADYRENGSNPRTGGLRNYKNHWDFFDTDADKDVDIDDVGAVASRFLKNVGEMGYLAAADRGAQVGPYIWNTAGPDGSIVIDDVAAVAAQFLHSCS